jgi:hypothetical protein
MGVVAVQCSAAWGTCILLLLLLLHLFGGARKWHVLCIFTPFKGR